MTTIYPVILTIILSPLLGALIAGLYGGRLQRQTSHRITIALMAVSFILACYIAKLYLIDGIDPWNANVYTWASGGTLFPFAFHIGFLIDPLTAIMLVVVTFVSLFVHIYSIGYMANDPGYARFFSYISLFTFSMLMLVSANNFLQLFFGWEAVGLVSYLLIGFWFKKESANQGSLKAFLVNRIGDFGFILGLAVLFAYAGSLDYQQVFAQADALADQKITLFPGSPWSVITVACILLFIGAMGKSAQVPLHVWLPESMEGPTPISALIHAATMVTAGVFMVARMSPLFEYSTTALSFILVIGATGALFTGLLAIVMHDIKRVIAYSTLSQLGYMMVAMGVSAYAAGIFHLVTHAAFKAVLFLGAGSVIMALHHEQDMRKMGGLARYMPITYATFLIGSLALAAIPPFAGFYSKDIIIEAAHAATIPGAYYAYYCVAIGAFVTSLYTFRALFLTFHGTGRMDAHSRAQLRESPWVVWLPLVALAIPSVLLGFLLIGPMLFDTSTLLDNSVFVLADHNVLSKLGDHYDGPTAMALAAWYSPIFWLALAGIIVAWIAYCWKPALPAIIAQRCGVIYRILVRKYALDDFNDIIFVRGARGLGQLLFKIGDRKIIDGIVVNGTALSVRWLALRSHVVQSGYLYHYSTVMVCALLLFLLWLLI